MEEESLGSDEERMRKDEDGEEAITLINWIVRWFIKTIIHSP